MSATMITCMMLVATTLFGAHSANSADGQASHHLSKRSFYMDSDPGDISNLVLDNGEPLQLLQDGNMLIATRLLPRPSRRRTVTDKRAPTVTEDKRYTVTDKRFTVTDKRAPTVTEKRFTVTDKRAPTVTDKRFTVTDKRGFTVTDKRAPTVTDKRFTVTDKRAPTVTDKRFTVTDKRAPTVTDKRFTVTERSSNPYLLRNLLASLRAMEEQSHWDRAYDQVALE